MAAKKHGSIMAKAASGLASKMRNNPILNKYPFSFPRDEQLEIVQSHDRNLPYPYGTKNSFFYMEDPIRFKWPGMSDYKGIMNNYAKKTGAHMIGEGIISTPPCSPQPVCRMWEGCVQEPLMLLNWQLIARQDKKRCTGEEFLFGKKGKAPELHVA
eukprot:CAMPEP_0169248586 /NCGR_PEP_ID=MMETSP1016-20121227/35928_1 /TAXON_ID=342587 /ORGANISM="Karlodinium micrum, Strain CCMP2283" /LENGTH=155 /DNA_ID=CAMNT_0009329405 /DNA_START=51 /DNA_END=518 /DNA_ORIENTATION=+